MITDKDLLERTLDALYPSLEEEPRDRTFRITRDTPVIEIKTPLQRRLALAYLKRWAKK